jgi:hypothetical protein
MTQSAGTGCGAFGEDHLKDVEIDYDFLTQQALKRVVRDVLQMTEELGSAPGDHHFYIEFDTRADGVAMPDHLLEVYPSRMTVVLQHQFDDLEVRDEGFAVTLWFKGQQARLTIPFDAVTSFADPSVQFGLRFDTPGGEPRSKPAEPTAVKSPDDAAEKGAAVLQLDAFRKK